MGNIMSSHQNQAKPNDSDLVILLRTGQKLQYKTQFSETAKLSIYLLNKYSYYEQFKFL